VFCAGDAALQFSRCHSRAIRVETWANAQNQAISVAANMIGEAKEYNDPPWFWTDQYDLNIQVAGDMLDCDHIVRGDERSGKFSIVATAARRRRCARSMPPRKWPCSSA
jgi:p-cumate 2,3-dioxygenase ferredoxin reductase subunit